MQFPEQFRLPLTGTQFQTKPGDQFGCFLIPGRHACGRILKIIANSGEVTGWDHASVTLEGRPDKCPSWDEMCVVKSLFWTDEQTVVEFHPAKQEYVNVHSGCLHLWHCTSQVFPTPPKFCV